MEPDEIIIWGSGTGSTILAGPLAIDSITYVADSVGLVDVVFAGATDLTGSQSGHFLVVSGATNAVNNGRFKIVETDIAGDRLRIKNTARISSTSDYDEATSPATAAVENGGPELIDIPTEKQELGYFSDEYPSAGQLNKILNNVTSWNRYLALGGAVVFRDSLVDWSAVDARPDTTGEFVSGTGFLRFDPDSTEVADGEVVVAPDDGNGRGFLELAHPDMIFVLLAAIIGDDPSTLYDLLHP